MGSGATASRPALPRAHVPPRMQGTIRFLSFCQGVQPHFFIRILK